MEFESYNVPRGTIEKYIELLEKWNSKINLVVYTDRNELISRHIIDSLQIAEYINENDIVYDIGSGAGFPGLMLSYAGKRNINLVEIINKKANFLISASVFTNTPPKIHNCDVKDIKTERCDLIIARGYSSLENILATTKNLTKKNTRYLLLKGKNIEFEIKNALEKWNFEYILMESITSDDGKILELKNVKSKEN